MDKGNQLISPNAAIFLLLGWLLSEEDNFRTSLIQSVWGWFEAKRGKEKQNGKNKNVTEVGWPRKIEGREKKTKVAEDRKTWPGDTDRKIKEWLHLYLECHKEINLGLSWQYSDETCYLTIQMTSIGPVRTQLPSDNSKIKITKDWICLTRQWTQENRWDTSAQK